MLAMTTLQIGHPMAFFILMVPDDILLHDDSLLASPLQGPTEERHPARHKSHVATDLYNF